MDCSIIILNYRTPGLLRVCLRGIASARLRFSYEVIVVDNGSEDDSLEIVRREFPWVKCIASSRNLGFAAGNNLGLRAARGEFILIMNADLAIVPNTLELLVDFLKRNSNVGLVAPQLRNPDGSIQISSYRFPTPWIPILRRTPLGKLPWGRRALRAYLMLDSDRSSITTVDWVLGGCMLARRTAIERVGLLDERYFLYFEDIDWCRRFWQSGLTVVYYPAVAITHYHRRQSAESPGLSGVFSRLTRVHITSSVKYFWKYRKQPLPVIRHFTLK